MPPIPAWLPVTAVLLAATLAHAQQKDLPIGNHGAHITADRTWRRQQLNADLGADQFNGSEKAGLFGRANEVYVVVTEVPGLFEGAEDYARVLDEQSEIARGQAPEVVTEGSWRRATRRGELNTKGLRLMFRCDLLVKPGLAYHVMSWSPLSQRDYLETRITAFLGGFAFPGPDSAFAKNATPVPQRLACETMVLTFAVPPNTLPREAKQESDTLKFRAAGGEPLLMVWAAGGYDTLDALVDAEAKTLRDWQPTYRETARRQLVIDGVPAVRLTGHSDEREIDSLVVFPDREGSAIVRYHTLGKPGAERPLREALFASVHCARLEPAIALPPIPRTTGTRRKKATRLANFIEQTPVWHTLDSTWVASARLGADGTVVMVHGRVEQLRGADRRQLFFDENRDLRDAVQWGEDWLVVADDKVYRLRDGALVEPALGQAEAIATAGQDLLLLRTATQPLPAVTSSFVHAALEIVRRPPDGREVVVATLPNTNGQGLVVSADGRNALVAGMVESPFLTGTSRHGLWSVDLLDGARTELPPFESIEALGTASDGWLVTGRPVGGAQGIWRLRPGAMPTPLVTGHGLRGLHCDGQQLLFATTISTDSVTVRRAPIQTCETVGRLSQPFGLRHLETLGRRVVAELGNGPVPDDPAAIAATLAQVDTWAAAMAGAPLPRGMDDVELLLVLAGYRSWLQPLSADGRLLLALLVAHVSLTEGATWVPSAAPTWSSWRTAPTVVGDGVMATCNHPLWLVSSSLDDGYGTPALVDQKATAEGRVVLLGLDPDRLLAQAKSLVPADLEGAFATADAAWFTQVLAGHPDNRCLRSACFAGLTAAGRFDVVAAVAQPWATGLQATRDDLLAWLSARAAGTAAAESAKPLFDDALMAVQRHPGDAALAVVLAAAAGKAFPEAPQRARLCWKRVLELARAGPFASTAQRELARLEGR